MSESNKANQDQIEYWNGKVGDKWRAFHRDTEAMLRPFTEILMARAAPFDGKTLIDIGCGAGETTILAANSGATALGLDISKPLLEVARSRSDISSTNAAFIEADASHYISDMSFDIAISRFGVMFFDDPISAFTNIHSLLKDGGRFYFVCWQDQSDNDWAKVPMRALDGLKDVEPLSNQEAPGPFAFAGKDRIEEILEAAGFKDTNIENYAAKMPMAKGLGIEGAVNFMLKIGPASRAIADLDEQSQIIAKARLSTVLLPYLNGESVELEGRVWLVSAAC